MAKVAQAVPQRARLQIVRDNFTKGGVLPEGPYLVKESSFVLFAYANKDGQPTGATTIAKRLMLQPVVKDAKGAFLESTAESAQDQHWSIGDPKNFVPSADGNFLEVVGKSTLSQQCKYFFLWDSLVNAGMPEQMYDNEGAKLLVGAILHVHHIPAPDYSRLRQNTNTGIGVAASAQPEKPKYDETIPVVKAILYAPWDKGGKKPQAAAPSTKPAPPAAAPAAEEPEAAEGETADNRVIDMIAKVVKSNGKMSRTKCRLEVHRAYNAAKIDAAERDEELKIFNDVDALTNALAEASISVDGDSVEFVS